MECTPLVTVNQLSAVEVAKIEPVPRVNLAAAEGGPGIKLALALQQGLGVGDDPTSGPEVRYESGVKGGV